MKYLFVLRPPPTTPAINTPGRFVSKTMIGFELAEAGEVTFTETDVAGKLLKVVNTEGVKGYNSITLESLKRNNDKTEVTVFPNPLSSIFTVNPTCINRGETSLVDMKIYNTSGQEIILRDKLNCNVPQEFNLEEHPKGVYILEIIYDDNTTIRKKLIKV